jgi:hypothetical protein
MDPNAFKFHINNKIPKRYGVYPFFPKGYLNEDCCHYTVNGRTVGTETVRTTRGPNMERYTYIRVSDGRSAWYEGWANDGDTITFMPPPVAPRTFECRPEEWQRRKVG